MAEEEINFKKIEEKWQKKWENKKAFSAKENSKKKKFYCLEMFPYPSASGLHMGHALNYTIGDIFSRFKRMNNFNVLYPMGFDAFGLPAENAAIKQKAHPKKFTETAIKNYIKQMKNLGLSYDWDRIVITCNPEYYKWNQYFFLKFMEKGLVYRKKSAVNFCSKCQTVLANEQVVGGKCWRHEDTEVEIKHLEQWFIKTTEYAEELLKEIPNLKWPNRIKTMQENWIGKSHGTEIDFQINEKKWSIFTTRPDTIYGVTFMVISAQHPKLFDLVTEKQKKEVEAFIKKLKSVSEKELEEMDKQGVFTGSYAVNPVTEEKIPVYAGNFVVADYGSGMVMAVPAHDQRDLEFAKKYNIPIKEVIMPVYGEKKENEEFRKTISAIVHRKKDNKFLMVKWKTDSWISPVIGGIETNEDLTKAAEREVLEETGYKVKFIKKLGGEIESHFYAPNKKVLRHRLDQPVLLELIEEKQKNISEEEKNKHDAIWLSADEAIKEVSPYYNILGLLRYLEKDEAYTEKGILVNSGKFSGIENEKAKQEITNFLEGKKLGRKTVNYKLRDWLISRQRYWGTPIPVVYCEKCGIVPVKEKDLPVELPEDVKFGEGNPLATNKSFVNTKCPKCTGKARRETDTMDTFFDSSWYFLRYTDNKNNKMPFDSKKVEYWMPVDQYIGGAEHACMHLIYSRFFTKALRDLKFIKISEPFIKLFNQGMLHGTDGEKMSKSKGNVILPEEVSEKYGIDTARLFLMSQASPDKDTQWDEKGIEGSLRLVKKMFSFFTNVKKGKSSEKAESKINKAIKEITEDIENFRYNLAIIKIRTLFEELEAEKEVSKKDLESFLKMVHPFCPHITEELWEKLGNKSFISHESWPKADESKINENLEKQEGIIKKTIEDIKNITRIIKEKQGKEAKKVYLYTIPKELEIYLEAKNSIKSSLNLDLEVFSVSDKNKYDPENKSGKTKPGKPAIYLE
ncbi:class I tRNA ligase family protein [Candidatus Pacearchaeota archaeon]|nr:class I tRNA ligase family protein [Candidatus Pacearchaeota archaeon]